MTRVPDSRSSERWSRRYLRRIATPDALKASGVALALVVVCAVPLLVFWPASGVGPPDSTTSSSVAPDVSLAQALGSGSTSSLDSTTTSTTEPAPIEVTIAAVGDVMGAQTVRWSAYDATSKTYDFYPMFAPVAPYIAGADYAVCNLETRLADPGPDGKYIGLHRMNSPQALGDALKQAGFDLCALANNHSLDMGFEGIVQTLDRLDMIGLEHIGCYRSLEDKQARQPFIVDINGIKVAFINYTDVSNGQFLAPQHKAYAVDFLGTDAAAAEAAAAKSAGADIVIMVVHWGKEDSAKQNSAQIKVAEGTADYTGLLQRGVDVILGSHSHVVQPATHVTYQTDLGPRETYVVYSMGNFLPDSQGWPQDSGLVIYVNIQKVGDQTRVTGLNYLPVVRQRTDTVPEEIRLLPVLPGTVPDSDMAIGEITQARMDKAWNYYQEMYDKPQDNIVPLSPTVLTVTKE